MDCITVLVLCPGNIRTTVKLKKENKKKIIKLQAIAQINTISRANVHIK